MLLTTQPGFWWLTAGAAASDSGLFVAVPNPLPGSGQVPRCHCVTWYADATTVERLVTIAVRCSTAGICAQPGRGAHSTRFAPSNGLQARQVRPREAAAAATAAAAAAVIARRWCCFSRSDRGWGTWASWRAAARSPPCLRCAEASSKMGQSLVFVGHLSGLRNIACVLFVFVAESTARPRQAARLHRLCVLQMLLPVAVTVSPTLPIWTVSSACMPPQVAMCSKMLSLPFHLMQEVMRSAMFLFIAGVPGSPDHRQPGHGIHPAAQCRAVVPR